MPTARLHVNERLDMVLTGDWNGPERRFRVGPDQWMRFESLTRVEPDGSEVSLVDLNQGFVDEYRYLPAEHLLRWRSRRESDPSFDHTELVCRIRYVVSGALRREADGGYGLAHDFAFERTSAIEHLRVRLELKHGWSTSWPSPIEIEQDHVQPGESTVLCSRSSIPAPRRLRSSVDPSRQHPPSRRCSRGCGVTGGCLHRRSF